MANNIQYFGLIIVAAVAFQWLSDRAILRVLSVATPMVLIPGALCFWGALDLRAELGLSFGGGASILGWSIVASIGVGALALTVCGAAASLRQAVGIIRWFLSLVHKVAYARVCKNKSSDA